MPLSDEELAAIRYRLTRRWESRHSQLIFETRAADDIDTLLSESKALRQIVADAIDDCCKRAGICCDDCSQCLQQGVCPGEAWRAAING